MGTSGDPAEAVRLVRDLVFDTTRPCGSDALETLLTRRQLAVNVGESGDLAEAARLLRDLVPDNTRVRGADALDPLGRPCRFARGAALRSGQRCMTSGPVPGNDMTEHRRSPRSGYSAKRPGRHCDTLSHSFSPKRPTWCLA